MRLLFLFLGLFPFIFPVYQSYAQLNLEQLGHVDYFQERNTYINDVWGYVDETGIEYALVGARSGVSVVSLADPENPVEVFWYEGDFSVWRDLKTFGDYLYVTTEAESGLLIIDLSPLPSGTVNDVSLYDGPSGNTWKSAHNLYIDENGFAYVFGSNRGLGGVIILDVSTDPMNPIEVGEFDNWYVHDGFVRNDMMYLAHIYDGFFSIVDITDKQNPVLLGTANTPSNFAHNIWPDNTGQYVFTTDEVSDAFLAAYDVSDPANIVEVDRIQSSPGAGIVPHNAHYYQNWLVTSYYTDGVTIHDVSRPHNMIEVGNYDTSPLQNTFTQGCWGAYPYFPSGIILATDIEEGLFILQPDYKLGSYLEGLITDQQTTNPLQGVRITIEGNDQVALTDNMGEYATGIAQTGTFDVTYNKVAYYPQTISVSLSEGNVTNQDVQLEPMPEYSLNVIVEDATTGNGIMGADVLLSCTEIEHEIVSNGLGEASVQMYYKVEYEVVVGKWGYRTSCENIYIDQQTGTLTIQLEPGYYDDFTFDFGWSATSDAEAGEWVRDIPLATLSGSNASQDVAFDCGSKAYITGNTGIDPNIDNVTNGTVVLISPVFNLTGMSDPHVNYWTYFYNMHGPYPPNDTLSVVLTNGFVTSRVDYEAFPDSPMEEWVPKSIRVSDYMAPTANMQLFISISDYAETVNITEAGFDYFSITNSNVLTVEEEESDYGITIFPNPADTYFEISSGDQIYEEVTLFDRSGKLVLQTQETKIDISDLSPGMYFIKIQLEGGKVHNQKLVVR